MAAFRADQDAHQARQVAESFGPDPARYDRTRPSYPSAMVERVIATSPGPDVLDVGCGTGIAARQFRSAGCRVLGVEVDERMAEFARGTGLEVEVAKFEDWDSGGRMFDAVIAGTTWHWVDPLTGARKAADVLRENGRLAVFWNVAKLPPAAAEAFAAVYQRVLPNTVFARGAGRGLDAYAGFFTKAADGMAEAGAFRTAEQWRFDWKQSYSRDQWLDQLPTAGGHSRFPPGTLRDLLDGIGEAIDDLGGTVLVRYATVVVTAVI
jgi:SAM-dependent methyltransferase